MNLALSTTSLVFVSILHISHGFGPAYGGDEFVRLKEIPPAVVAARASGSITLACSVTGSPTPTVAWYRNGKRLAGTQASPGGLGETWARLHLACLSEADAGVYECKGEASGRHVSISTQLNIVHHAPHTGCRPRDRTGGPPTITGWQSSVLQCAGQCGEAQRDLEERGWRRSPAGRKVQV